MRSLTATMHRDQIGLLSLNVLGGAAVLASYALGIAWHPSPAETLWGGVPESWRGLYTINMFLAAFGYFAFTTELLLRSDPRRARIGPFGYSILYLAYALVLIPSALWLPLTFAYAAAPSPLMWLVVRADLFAVAAGATLIVLALLRLEPCSSRAWRAVALIGVLPFWLQTAMLDAIVWPHWYHVAR